MKTKLNDEENRLFRSKYQSYISKLPKYDIHQRWQNTVASKSFNGCGLVLVDTKPYDNSKLYKSYDLNNAYASTLLDYKYPLSYDMTVYQDCILDIEDVEEQFKDKLYIVKIHIINMKQKLKGFYYNIYKSKDSSIKEYYEDGNLHSILYLTSVDLNTIKILYSWDDAYITDIFEFTDVGYFSDDFRLFINREYIQLKAQKGTEGYATSKKIFEMITYGLSAKKDKIFKQYRNRRVIISTFQIAYIRFKMAYLFLKYKDFVKQVDTDGMIVTNDCPFEEPIGRELGKFKCEFEGQHVVTIRPKAYIVFNEENYITEWKFNSLKYRLSDRQINELLNTGEIIVTEPRTFKETGETRNIDFLVEYLYYTGNFEFALMSKP